MKLWLLNENGGLDVIADFKIRMWADLEEPDLKHSFQEMFTVDPPPGITPIDGQVVDVSEPDADDMVIVTLRTSVEDFVRNSVEYDNDPYFILDEVKKFAGPAAASAAYQFMSDDANDLRIAMLKSDDGGLDADSWPTRPKL